MDRKSINIDNFEHSIRSAVKSAEIAPSSELWDRVSSSLDVATTVTPMVRLLRWGSVAAACIAIAALLPLSFMSEDIIESSYIAKISNFEMLEDAEFYVAPRMLPASSLPPLAYEEVTSIEENQPLEVAPQQDQDDEYIQTPPTPKTPEAPEENYTIYMPSNTASQGGRMSLALMASGSSSSYTAGDAAAASSSIIASPCVMSTSEAGYADLTKSESYQPISSHHYAPISFALSVDYKINENWSFESGLSYTRLISDVTMPYSTSDLRQCIEFIGVPLRAKYKFYTQHNLSLYGGAGIHLERCISASIAGKSIDERAWHSSVELLGGLQYNINRWLGIYAEPAVSHYFSPTNLESIRSQSPVSFNLHFGLRFFVGR
ncbi:MAG: porin family protein [Rikenellaceae bacterium]